MLFQVTNSGLSPPLREHEFHPTRAFRFDLAWPEIKLGVEIDGGIWMPRSGHTSGKGYTADREKDAEALCLGWTVLRVTTDQVKNGSAIKWLLRIKDILHKQKENVINVYQPSFR
jgi:very-short-patch-repair endonuclease